MTVRLGTQLTPYEARCKEWVESYTSIYLKETFELQDKEIKELRQTIKAVAHQLRKGRLDLVRKVLKEIRPRLGMMGR